MRLVDFVTKPEHFVAREKLLHAKATFDFKLSAAKVGVQLQMTEPEIDNIGHDFAMWINFNSLFVQNKALVDSAGTKTWKLHTRFLQADFQNRDICPEVDTGSFFGKLPVGGMEGAYGAFLLHEISAEAARQNELKVNYYFFDINLANCVRSEVIKLDGFPPDVADDFLRKVAFPKESDKRVVVRKEYMLPISAPEALLSLRMHVPSPTNYMSLGGRDTAISEDTVLKEGLRKQILAWVPTEEFGRTVT